ncbi:MAG: hypothetical protein Q4C77_19875 [Eubacteriales bacterium]|nr:hypothetical protein [Eubacteriales bacterium]
MRRKRWESKIAQFSYDHRGIDNQLSRLQKSAGELSKMLDNMSPKSKDKKEENEK